VGTELLLGQIVNSNATDIGSRLALAGLDHYHQSVVGDNLERVATAIRHAVGRSDAVIITGGIGPTQDDITRESICAAAGVEMEFSEAYAERLRGWWARRDRPMPETNLRQAEYPAGADLIDNPKGTAPGLRLRIGEAWVFALPGVPQEMLPMVDEDVIPFLLEASDRAGSAIESVVLRTYGESESRIAEILDDLFESSVNPTMAFLASAAEIKVRLTARAATAEAAREMIVPLEHQVRARLGRLVFASGMEPVESMVLAAAAEHGWTIGTAESATGGLVAARLTAVPGASATYRGSVVAYSTELKHELLDVGSAIVQDQGVVSEQTAIAMAEGGAVRLGVDVCLAVTGSAGPDPQEQEVGTMIFAVRTPDAVRARTLRLPGDRERIRTYASTAGLHMLRLALAGEWWH
ncbi:MAG: competence/damage-inducible protein A, partial [Acidimicrobiia bacterium]